MIAARTRARTTLTVASPHALTEWVRRSEHDVLRARLRSDAGVDVAWGVR